MGYNCSWKAEKANILNQQRNSHMIVHHVPVVAVTTHQSTPAKAGGDPLPDRLQPFTEGSDEEPFAVEPAGLDSAQEREPEVLPIVHRPKNKPTR